MALKHVAPDTGILRLRRTVILVRPETDRAERSSKPVWRQLRCAIPVLLSVVCLFGLPAATADEPPQVIVVESMTTALIRHAEIAARDTGVLKSLLAKSGENVTEGQLLGSLDDELHVLAVREAELNLKIAELKANNNLPVETARAQVREAEQEKLRLEIAARISEKLADSDVAVRLAEKSREVAQFELSRAQKARDAFSGSISNAELNRLQVLFDQRSLEIEKAQEDRAISAMKPDADKAAVSQQTETVARSQLLASEREQEQQVAKTSVEVAKTELDLARLQLERRRLTAPFAATVVSVSRQQAEWVEPGTIVLRLIAIDRLRVEGFIGAQQATIVREGHDAQITFPGMDLDPVHGQVTYISPEVEAVNQQVLIWAEFENPNRTIRPGLIASMEISASAPPASGPANAPSRSAKRDGLSK